MKKHFLTTSLLLIFSASIAFGQDIKFPELNLPDSLKSGKTKVTDETKNADDEIKEQALEFFNAVLNGNAEVVFKYVHPLNITGGMTKRFYLKKVIEPQLKDLSGKSGLLDTVEVTGIERSTENGLTRLFVKNVTKVSTPDGEAEFEGLMEVIVYNGKNYFIGVEGAILDSFGLQGLDDEDETGGENPVVDEDASGLVRKGVLNGTAINLPVPEYPKAARAANVTGTVNVEVVIDKDGKVRSAKAVSGHPLLLISSEKAALSAKFKPTTLSGQPVEVSGIIIYNFMK